MLKIDKIRFRLKDGETFDSVQNAIVHLRSTEILGLVELEKFTGSNKEFDIYVLHSINPDQNGYIYFDLIQMDEDLREKYL